MGCLYCQTTGERLPLDTPIWRSSTGGLLDIELNAAFPRGEIARRPPGMWRYREALPPFDDADVVTFGEGFTPLVRGAVGGRSAWLKLDYLFPSGSYKDRGASVLVSQARRLGIRRVVEDSSGNAGAAIAAYCARAGIACDIYVPAATAPAKVAQIRAYGAGVIGVAGDRAATAAAAWDAAQREYYASHAWNPFFLQGTKTIAFEIVEQLGWRAPDVVIIPVGNGTLLLGAYIGFRELRDAGVIDALPRLIGVQAAACAPLHAAWQSGRDQIEPAGARPTIAEGIAIANPVRGGQCFGAVRATNGEFVAVTDEEIDAARREAQAAGFFIEPSSAAALAALRQWEVPGDTIVVPLTGHGLKAALPHGF